MIVLEVKLEQDGFRWSNYGLYWKKKAEITYLAANKQQTKYGLIYLDILK